MSPYLAWFDEIPDEELAHAAGGKGASLCRMSRAGLPVPKGFIVRSEMFNAFMEANGLWDYVFEKLDTIDFSSDASLISVAAEIRERIINSPVPQEMAEDIVRFYSQVGDARQPVAVRSSGTAEDLDDASFAGQQETFLFVIGNDDVVKYIKECWASLYNDRAIFYRREKHFDERSISIAVVVQCMVNAQKAGVMFTSNPITNDYDTVVLEAAWGLGEAIVSGIVTPDNLWINKHTGEVTTDRYGRSVPKHAHGTENLERYTSSSKRLVDAATALYERVVNPKLLVRRMYLTATHVLDAQDAPGPAALEQLDLFTDYQAVEQARAQEDAELEREHQRQKAVLEIKRKFGKNAILKGISFTEGATARERNGQIGGHKA